MIDFDEKEEKKKKRRKKKGTSGIEMSSESSWVYISTDILNLFRKKEINK